MLALQRLRPFLGIITIFVFGATLTAVFTYESYIANNALQRQRNQRIMERVIQHLQQEAGTRDLALNAVEALHISSDHSMVTSSMFALFAETFTPFIPGNQAVQWINAEHVVEYIYPLNEENALVQGFDNKLYPNRLAPILRAHEEGKTIASEPLQLMQGFPGIIFFHPISKGGHSHGTAVVVQRLSSLMKGIAPLYSPANTTVEFQTDTKRISADGRSLYTLDGKKIISADGKTADELIPQIVITDRTIEETIEMFGTKWTIRVTPTPSMMIRDFRDTLMIALTSCLTFLVIAIYQIRLKRIMQREKEFVSLVAHQLRAPATQMSWLLETFENKSTRVSKAQQELLADLKTISANNKALVDDLLNISRLERGMLPVDLMEVALAELLVEAERPLKGDLQIRKTRYKASKKVTSMVMVDRQKAVEAIRNILHNAIVHNPTGTSITVEEVASQKPGYAVLAIHDTGEGIPPDVIPTLFKRATKRSSTGSRDGGSGLGLYLAMRFMKLMQGDIRYETGPEGTTFFLSFPKKMDV